MDTSKLKPTGYVNDFAGVLNPSSKAQLEAYCANIERQTGAQFAVALVPSLDGEPIENVAVDLFQKWRIGKKGTDEGLLLLMAINDRKQRAEVGYGLEPYISDGFAGGVLRSIRPILRQGDYGSAIAAALQQFGQHLAEGKGINLTTGLPQPRSAPGPVEQEIPWPLILGGIFLLWALLGSLGGRGRGGRGGPGSFITGMILGNLLSQGRRYNGRGGWGGGGFGGYDGGGGFGGFGGGSSGGGGASSDW